MIAVVVRVQNIFNGLIGDALDLVDDVVEIVFELVVHQDDTFVRDVDGDVTSIAFNFIKVVGNLVQLVRRPPALILGVSEPGPGEKQDPGREA